jgi:hypothetical protein
MTRNLLKAINLIALITLLALIAYTAVVLFSSYRSRNSNARLEITRLGVRAKTLLSLEQQDFETNLSSFRQNLVRSSNIKSFVLYNAEDELIYVYARNPRYIKVSQDSEQFLRQSIHLPFNNLLEINHKVQLSEDSPIYGEGVYRIYTPAGLLSLSTTIFYVLAALTILLLISLIGAGRSAAPHSGTDFSESSAGQAVSPPPAHSHPNKSNNSELSFSSSSGTAPAAEHTDDESLYAPDSGLCFEQHLAERLSNELRRAAAFDEDLVTALIQCGNAREDRLTYIQLAQSLKNHFHFHDMLFEIEHDKMAVILPNADLEQGINELSDFQKAVYKDSGEKLCTYDIKIGLSSRNGRLINSDRILKEARAALRKAEFDIETNLIGFRPDPGKFRSFLAAQED